eukprot:gnl/MRDRNA2_/MRDRNA2_297945_c0_seq1.p1 gnl/MRDRNA2_/MRDRNA2_297945_c0~~gnl/MRDRNA2_/MRDRNA2_297945_c0_seq1.p1  ORF type:complete len:261 (-),score=41.88 gnl/MRDRNA2_/MRDRNA2_297945_c0_seq1:27-755(-)
MYRPSVLCLQDQSIVNLQAFIWENRSHVTPQTVRSSDEYGMVTSLYPDLKPLIDTQVEAMVAATKTYGNPEHAYEIHNGCIGYVEHGTVNTNLMHGYNTTFSYFKERERGRLNQDCCIEKMGINIRCGSFSYAEIPHAYDRVLGVTGTLSSLGVFQKSVIRDVYKIKKQTLMPSMYGKRDANFHEGVHVEMGTANYYRKIQEHVKHIVAAERALLVFFESEARLKEFIDSEYGELSRTRSQW